MIFAVEECDEPGEGTVRECFCNRGSAADRDGVSACDANPQDFSGWLDGVRAEARANGISQNTIDIALNGIEPLPRVIELDRNQPESTLRFEDYMARWSARSASTLVAR